MSQRGEQVEAIIGEVYGETWIMPKRDFVEGKDGAFHLKPEVYKQQIEPTLIRHAIQEYNEQALETATGVEHAPQA